MCFKIIRVPVEESWKRSQPSARGGREQLSRPVQASNVGHAVEKSRPSRLWEILFAGAHAGWAAE